MDNKGLSLLGGYVYSMNIVIGAGFLSIPYAFLKSGVILSLVYLTILSIQNIYLTLMFLDLLHRVKYFKAWKDQGTELKLSLCSTLTARRYSPLDLEYPEISHITRMDVCTSMFLIFGPRFGMFYLIIITISFTGSLTAYISIFSSSFASNIPLGNLGSCDIYQEGLYSSCGLNYRVYILIYAAISLYLTLKGLKEQKIFQFLMCIFRFLVINVIIICCFFLVLRGKDIESDKELIAKPSLADPSGSGKTIPIILFALLYQLKLPSVAAMVEEKQKNLWKIVVLVAMTSFIFYGALGIIAPFSINNIDSEVSINFRNYSAGYAERAPWMELISFIVVMFPAFDVISSFPLCSVALADNWIAKLITKGEVLYKLDRVLKILIVLTPVTISMFVYDLGAILKLIGILPLFTFNVMVPVAYIPVRTLISAPSPYQLKYYHRSLNIFLAFLNFALMIYFFLLVAFK